MVLCNFRLTMPAPVNHSDVGGSIVFLDIQVTATNHENTGIILKQLPVFLLPMRDLESHGCVNVLMLNNILSLVLQMVHGLPSCS